MENNSTKDIKATVCDNYANHMTQLANIINGRLGKLENSGATVDVFRTALREIYVAIEWFSDGECSIDQLGELCGLFASMSAHMKCDIYSDIFFKCAQKMDNLTSSVSEFLNYGEVDKNIDLLAKEEQ